MINESSSEFWQGVIEEVMAGNNRLIVRKVNQNGHLIPPIEYSGMFKRSIGEPHGQIADWRAEVPGTIKGVHVLEFPMTYQVHLDKHDPRKDPVGHLLFDSPKTLVSLISLIAIIRWFLIRRRRGFR